MIAISILLIGLFIFYSYLIYTEGWIKGSDAFEKMFKKNTSSNKMISTYLKSQEFHKVGETVILWELTEEDGGVTAHVATKDNINKMLSLPPGIHEGDTIEVYIKKKEG